MRPYRLPSKGEDRLLLWQPTMSRSPSEAAMPLVQECFL